MSDIATKYRTLAPAAGFFDLGDRGRVEIGGSDRISFLQALVTNDVASLASGDGVYASYLTPQGRMVSDLEIFCRGDRLLLEVPSVTAPWFASRLDALIFAEDVSIRDVSKDTVEIAVAGSAAASAVAAAFALDGLGDMRPLSHLDAGAVTIIRAVELVVPMFKIVAPLSERSRVLQAIGGLPPFPLELVEFSRIAAGHPRFGVDMDETTIPLEAGLLDRAISTTKGCYVGQEIIIRILHRGGGRVARRLVRLNLGSSSIPERGVPLLSSGKEVGRITSAASAEGLVVALGYVQRELAEAGQVLRVFGSDAVATISGFAQ